MTSKGIRSSVANFGMRIAIDARQIEFFDFVNCEYLFS